MSLRSARRCLLVIVALTIFSVEQSAFAQLDVTTPQVNIESRIVNVRSEVLANLGVAWNTLDGSYSSTGGQAPAHASSSGTFGTAGVSGNLWVNPGSGPIPLVGPLAASHIKLGAGVGVNGYFGTERARDILRIIRHHPLLDRIDVIGSYGLDWTVDFTANLRFPIISSSSASTLPDNTTEIGAKRTPVIVNLDLFVGPSIVGTQTELRVDQSAFGGTNDKVHKRHVDVVPLVGGAISKKITSVKVPLLGEIPVLGRLFYGARYMPGSDVSNPSTFGFTEKFHTSPFWHHEARAELVLVITPQIVRQE